MAGEERIRLARVELAKRELARRQSSGGDPSQSPQADPGFMDQAKSAVGRLAGVPGQVAQNLTPEKMSPYLPVAGAVAGMALGGPLGGAAGAGLGQIGARMADIGYGRVDPADASDPFKESLAPMAQTALSGIPGSKQGQAALGYVGRGLAKAGETLSGAKRDILGQATRQGYSTYGAPSLGKAEEIFGKAIGPKGAAALKQNASEAFDPALGKARSIASDVGAKLEAGESVTAIEALQAKQATDRVISATPITDKLSRRALFEWRNRFNEVMTSQSGELGAASSTYRKAIVRDKLLSPTRLNKSGEPSAFLPLVLGAGGRGAGGVISTLTGTSPALWGLGATTIGEIGKHPTLSRAALAAFISKVTTKDNP